MITEWAIFKVQSTLSNSNQSLVKVENPISNTATKRFPMISRLLYNTWANSNVTAIHEWRASWKIRRNKTRIQGILRFFVLAHSMSFCAMKQLTQICHHFHAFMIIALFGGRTCSLRLISRILSCNIATCVINCFRFLMWKACTAMCALIIYLACLIYFRIWSGGFF